MSDSLFQIAGVSSGIAWDEIINKTLESAKKPAEQWQNKIDTLEVKKTLYQQLSSQFQTLRNSLTKLRQMTTYVKKTPEYTVYTPTGADPSTILNAKVTNQDNAQLSTWEIEVKNIAKKQRYVSNQFEPGDPLGVEGSFRLFVGSQYTTINVESTDSIRTINLKVQQAKDQHGNAMGLTAKLLDNRLVIESALTGLDSSGPARGTAFKMPDVDDGKVPIDKDDLTKGYTYEMFLPRSAVKEPADTLNDPPDLSKGYKDVYPPQILSFMSKDNTTVLSYKEGVDYEYDPDRGVITWYIRDNSKIPTEGTEFNVMYSDDLRLKRSDSGLIDNLPPLETGMDYAADTNFQIFVGTKEYIMDADPTKGDFWFDHVNQQIVWHSGKEPAADTSYVIRVNANNKYETHQNVVYMEAVDDADYASSRSVLSELGFITPGTDKYTWTFNADNVQNAEDAVFTIDGITVTRSSNILNSDNGNEIIAHVELELKGEGKLRLDITQDASEAVELMETFVESYNLVMEWINHYISQKEDAANPVDEEDYLSSIIQESKGNTVFGVLHGDQMLASIKDQMRKMLSNPIQTVSNSVSTRKYLHTDTPLQIAGSYYLYVDGRATRINVEEEDSLEDIEQKLRWATNLVTADGKNAMSSDMNLKVEIRDGQLVISPPDELKTKSPHTQTVKQSKGTDILDFVPQSGAPISGKMTVYSGGYQQDSAGNIIKEPTFYQEGVDYDLKTEILDNGLMQSSIVWRDGKAPKTMYNISYEHNQKAVAFEFIPESGDLSALNLHYDTSKMTLSSFGLETMVTNDKGTGGYLEFDSDVFFEAMKSDCDTVGSVMTTFFRELDSYIGNLVDTSPMLVAGSTVTKGRIASKLNSIDDEIKTLNDRITTLEKQLKDKQTAMYKQYSNMEVAIQKLNAQMSSMTQYFNNMSNNK